MGSDAQLHVVALHSDAYRDSVQRSIAALGASLAEFQHPEVLLAALSTAQAAAVGAMAGVRHVAPVGINRRVHRFRVQLGEDGHPDAAYEVRGNAVIRVEADAGS